MRMAGWGCGSIWDEGDGINGVGDHVGHCVGLVIEVLCDTQLICEWGCGYATGGFICLIGLLLVLK